MIMMASIGHLNQSKGLTFFTILKSSPCAQKNVHSDPVPYQKQNAIKKKVAFPEVHQVTKICHFLLF